MTTDEKLDKIALLLEAVCSKLEIQNDLQKQSNYINQDQSTREKLTELSRRGEIPDRSY